MNYILGNIKGKDFWDNKTCYGNSKTSLVGSNYVWELPSIPKTSEPFEKLLELFSDVIFDAEVKPEVTDELVSFDEVIMLELTCMVALMSADDLFCRLVIDALIFYEQSTRKPFQVCLQCWSSWYLVIWDLSLWA